jgi:hypothetical protein
MKDFNYTGRSKSGCQVDGVVQAGDRARALMILRDQGVVALSITEKRGTSKGIQKLPVTPLTMGVFLISLMIVALLGWWLLRQVPPSTKSRVTHEKKKLEQSFKEKKNLKVTARIDKPETSVGAGQTEPLISAVVEKKQAVTETNGVVEGLGTATNRMFKGMTEQALSMIESVQPGSRIPPIPLRKGMEADFQQAMTNIIVINETDSEQTAKHKEDVAWLKQDIVGLVKQGLTPEQAIREIEKFRKEQASLKQDYVKYVVELRKSGQHEEADAFIKEANVILQKEGIIPLPETLGKTRSK